LPKNNKLFPAKCSFNEKNLQGKLKKIFKKSLIFTFAIKFIPNPVTLSRPIADYDRILNTVNYMCQKVFHFNCSSKYFYLSWEIFRQAKTLPLSDHQSKYSKNFFIYFLA